MILKAVYDVTFENKSMTLLVSHFYEDDHRSVKLVDGLDGMKMRAFLLYGMEVPSGEKKGSLSKEEKTVIALAKQLSDRFVLTEKVQVYRWHGNVRGVLSSAKESRVAPSVMKDYVERFDEQPLYILTKNNDVQSHMFQEGLPLTRPFPLDGTRVRPNSVVLMDDADISGFKDPPQLTYLLYSLEQNRAGPLLIPGVTACLDCYDTYYAKESTNQVFSGYHRRFILNFLVNAIYYCINDLYRYMGIDIGLPIRKYFQLSSRDLSMTVTDVYKTRACHRCGGR